VIQKERHSGKGGSQFSLWYDGAISKYYSQPPARVARDLNLGGLKELRLV
jgi:hypothetical protein